MLRSRAILTLLSVSYASFLGTLSRSTFTSAEPILESSFSVRSTIERYEDGQHRATIKNLERYSHSEGRAVVDIEAFDLDQGESIHSAYYHNSHSDLWLFNKLQLCRRTTRAEFNEHIYGLDLPSVWSILGITSDIRTQHVVGAAYILKLVDHLRGNFSLMPEFKNIRNIEAVMFHLKLQSDNQAYSQARVQVYFARWQQAFIFQPDVFPLQVVIGYEKPQSTNLIRINYFSLSELPDANLQQATSESSSFMFPLVSGCSHILSLDDEQKNLAEKEMINNMSEAPRCSFNVKLNQRLSSEPESIGLTELRYSYVLDSRAKLLRKVGYNSQFGLTSVTVYDFESNKKYNTITSSKGRSHKTEKLLTTNNLRQTSSSCVTTDLARFMKPTVGYPILANFDKLQYMGRSVLESRIVLVYEDSETNQLPIWLFPPTVIKDQSVSSVLLDPRGSLGHVNLIYYFVPENQDENKRSYPVRIDVIIRDDSRKMTLYSAQLDISDFSWSNQPITEGSSVFGIENGCRNERNLDEFQVSFLMEPNSVNELSKDSLKTLHKQLNNRFSRYDYLGDALLKLLRVSPLELSNLDSKLVRKEDLVKEKGQLPVLQVNLRLNNRYKIYEELTCISLGRGRFFDNRKMMRQEVSTFEECMWFANYYSIYTNKEIAFVFSKQLECLIYELELTTRGTLPVGGSTTNNFFPYEHGEYVVYKLTLNESPKDEAKFDRKVTDLISRKVTLTPTDSTESLSLSYTIKQVAIDQVVKQSGYHFDDVAWNVHDNHVRVVNSGDVSVDVELENRNIMTEVSCRTLCLLDADCKSFSYCDSRGIEPSECCLSSYDIRKVEFANQIGAILGKHELRLGGSSKFPISFKLDDDSSNLNLKYQKRCSLQSKSHKELFEMSYQITVASDELLDVSNISSLEQCAERCYLNNLDYLKGTLVQKWDLIQAHSSLSSITDSEAETDLSDLTSILDWRRLNIESLCSGFYYCDNCGKDQDGSRCILKSNSQLSKAKTMISNKTKQQEAIIMSLSKLIYRNMYERMGGFRLVDSATTWANNMGGNSQASDLMRVKSLIALYQEGENVQTKGLDEVESCARACTLQTYGPRPFCSSFDVVYERLENGINSYCLFNSQSFHDLKMKSKLEGNIVYSNTSANIYYWHYEPRESKILPEDIDGAHRVLRMIKNGNSLVGHKMNTKTDINSNRFTVITFLISLIGVSSGLLLGSKLSTTYYNLRHNSEEENFNFDVVRLVHRLSGVSLGRTRLENEVMM